MIDQNGRPGIHDVMLERGPNDVIERVQVEFGGRFRVVVRLRDGRPVCSLAGRVGRVEIPADDALDEAIAELRRLYPDRNA